MVSKPIPIESIHFTKDTLRGWCRRHWVLRGDDCGVQHIAYLIKNDALNLYRSFLEAMKMSN